MSNLNVNGDITVTGEGQVAGNPIVTRINSYLSGNDGYILLKIGTRTYMEVWGRINQSFSDNKQYDFTLPNGVSFNNANWNLEISASGYGDCAWLNSEVSGNNSFWLKSQRYSNSANTLNVYYKASGFVS